MAGKMISTRTDNRQRVFIGIPLDERVQDDVDKLLHPWRSRLPGLRWVPTVNRHLTLAFLGDIPSVDVETLRPVFRTAYRGEMRFEYRFKALQRFPNARGRIVALTGEVPAPLQGLVELTRDMLRRQSLPFEERRFRPHVTLARIKSPEVVKDVIDAPAGIAMDVGHIALYRSTLTRAGSAYTVLQKVSLR